MIIACTEMRSETPVSIETVTTCEDEFSQGLVLFTESLRELSSRPRRYLGLVLCPVARKTCLATVKHDLRGGIQCLAQQP